METKGKNERDLNYIEEQKIRHAELLFQELNKDSNIEVKFETQFKAEDITEIIRRHL